MVKILRNSSLATGLLLLMIISGIAPKAKADDDAKIEARILVWGRTCKNEIASRFGTDVSMADIDVRLGATLQLYIDAGTMTLEDIKETGLSYGWDVKKKNAYGVCNTNGKGEITDFIMNIQE